MDDDKPDRSDPPLNGWKEIAAYLGKSVRSVQRWEASLGLPVHRIRTPDGHIVYGDRAEIDAWRRQLDAPPVPEPEDPLDPESLPETDPPPPPVPRPAPPRVPRAWLVGFAVACLTLFLSGLALGSWLARPSPLATDVVLTGRFLQGVNPVGAVAWSHEFDGDVSGVGPRPLLVDVDGDEQAEWLIGVHYQARGSQAATSDGLYCITQDGRRKWVVRPDQNLTYPDRTMSAPWVMTNFTLSPGKPRTLWVSYAHHTGGSSFVLAVSSSGTPELRYVQFGRIYALEHWSTPSGGVLAVGGASDEHKRATLALLPDTDPPSSYPIDDPRRATCRECPRHTPRRVFLFPESELTVANHELHPYVVNITTVGPALKAAISQGGGRSQVFLSPDFTINFFDFTQNYWGAHKSLEAKGRLDHPAEDCPDRRATQVIREWTADEGWKRWAITPGGKSGPARLLADDEGM